MAQSTAERMFETIDQELDALAGKEREPQVIDYAPRTVRIPPLPSYVEHREGIDDIGKLSAEAMVRGYEETAKAIEAMATELSERARQCEAMVRETLSIRDEVKEVAARYREESKRIFIHIQDCSLVAAEVRKTCTEIKTRIVLPVTATTT
jgi:hypothetical protein